MPHPLLTIVNETEKVGGYMFVRSGRICRRPENFERQILEWMTTVETGMNRFAATSESESDWSRGAFLSTRAQLPRAAMGERPSPWGASYAGGKKTVQWTIIEWLDFRPPPSSVNRPKPLSCSIELLIQDSSWLQIGNSHHINLNKVVNA